MCVCVCVSKGKAVAPGCIQECERAAHGRRTYQDVVDTSGERCIGSNEEAQLPALLDGAKPVHHLLLCAECLALLQPLVVFRQRLLHPRDVWEGFVCMCLLCVV